MLYLKPRPRLQTQPVNKELVKDIQALKCFVNLMVIGCSLTWPHVVFQLVDIVKSSRDIKSIIKVELQHTSILNTEATVIVPVTSPQIDKGKRFGITSC